MRIFNISSLKLLLLLSGIIVANFGQAQNWTTSGNSVSGGSFLGTTNNEPLPFYTDNHQAMVILANGHVGIGTSDPHYTLQVVGDVVDSGNFFATNIETSNSISIGQFRMVDGIVDSIVSTSGSLQLSATIVNADGALTAAGSLTAGGSDTAITINGHTGTITSGLKMVGFSNDTINTTGKLIANTIAINTHNVPSGYSLAINGAVIATDIYVELYGSWPDYVFDKNYTHRTLEELETYINSNHHLPNMPSVKEVKDKGSISVGEIVTQNTKEIEELTLDLIELNKEVKTLEEQNKQLLEEINKKK